jgi:hypothetical protein
MSFETELTETDDPKNLAATADRVILPNEGEAGRTIYDKSKYDCKFMDGCIEIAENSDNVSHPPHYANGWSNGAEVIDLTEHLSFCAGNVVKYVCRAGRKDPDKHVEDLEKARWYLDREIARVKEH